MGNSGTAARLMMGLVASHPITTFFTGDASLAKRPMARVTTPLEQMGASFVSHTGGRLPLAVIGTETRSHHLPPAGRLGPGEVRDPAGRPQQRHHRDRGGTDPRPFRTDADPFRRHRDATRSRAARSPSPSPASRKSPAARSTSADQLRRFPDRRGLIRPGSDITLTDVGMNRVARPLRHPDRDGRRHHLPEPPDRSRENPSPTSASAPAP